jgi:hypothetical protein
MMLQVIFGMMLLGSDWRAPRAFPASQGRGDARRAAHSSRIRSEPIDAEKDGGAAIRAIRGSTGAPR